MIPGNDIYRRPAGISRQLTTFDPDKKSKTIIIPSGQRVTLGQVEGAGLITRIWLTFPRWFWPYWEPTFPTDPTVLKALVMRIYWDGATTPAVEVPVGDFFGAGHCEYNSFTSRYVGTSSGGFYAYWPMPYATGFRIEFENRHPTLSPDIFLNINYQELDAKPADADYFCSQFHTGRRQGTDEALVLETEGAGHYVGIMLHMQGEPYNYLRFLESPEYFFIDDDWDAPRIVGTGLEDYFNGGWYFREGPFAGPVHGVVMKDPLRSMITMYRLHEQDAIGFDRRIRMLFSNPCDPKGLHPYWYASTAYYYSQIPAPAQPTLPSHDEVMSQYRRRDRDHLSIP